MQLQYTHALCYPPCSTCMSLKNQRGAAEKKTAGHVLKAMLLLCYLLISAATAYLLLSSEQTTK